MKMNELGLAILKSFESCRLHAYPDPATGAEPYTVGYGCTGGDIGPGTVWTEEEAEEQLEKRVAEFSAAVQKLLKVAVTEDQFSALVDFAFNEGAHKLAGSTLLAHINAGEHDEAAQIEKWHFAAGKDMKGLRDRRAAEAALYAGDHDAVVAMLSKRGVTVDA